MGLTDYLKKKKREADEGGVVQESREKEGNPIHSSSPLLSDIYQHAVVDPTMTALQATSLYISTHTSRKKLDERGRGSQKKKPAI